MDQLRQMSRKRPSSLVPNEDLQKRHRGELERRPTREPSTGPGERRLEAALAIAEEVAQTSIHGPS